MTLAQKLKRVRALLLDSAVREEIERALAGEEPEEIAATTLDRVGEAIEVAQEHVAEAAAEKGMNRS